MPEMDGLAATRAIRASTAPAGEVPIIAMSADALPQQVERCYAAGMVDHIAKPCSARCCTPRSALAGAEVGFRPPTDCFAPSSPRSPSRGKGGAWKPSPTNLLPHFRGDDDEDPAPGRAGPLRALAACSPAKKEAAEPTRPHRAEAGHRLEGRGRAGRLLPGPGDRRIRQARSGRHPDPGRPRRERAPAAGHRRGRCRRRLQQLHRAEPGQGKGPGQSRRRLHGQGPPGADRPRRPGHQFDRRHEGPPDPAVGRLDHRLLGVAEGQARLHRRPGAQVQLLGRAVPGRQVAWSSRATPPPSPT
jgi:CheY-like chemotaxis protein